MTAVTSVTGPASFNLGAFDSVRLNGGRGTIAFTSAAPNVAPSHADKIDNKTFGPYGAPMSVVLTVNSGSCDYTITYGDPALQALVSGGGIGRPNTLAIIGDSISGYNFQRITATAVTRTSNVVSVTAASHGIPNGARVALYGVTNDETMNTSWAIGTRVDANTITFPSIGADGTGTLSTARLVNLQNWSAQGYLAWALSLSNARAKLVYAGVRGGATTDQIVASGFITQCIAAAPGNAIVMLGINNATGADGADTIISKLYSQIYQPLLAASIRVFAMALMPVGSGLSSFAAVTAKILQVNEGIRRLCASTPGMVFVNDHRVLVDPLNASAGAAATGILNGTDNLHPQDKGGYVAAGPLATALTTALTPLDDLVASNGDNYGTSTSNKNLLDAGLMTGTTGTVAGSVTNGGGVGVATNWVCDSSGTVTSATATLSARSDGYGYDQVLTFKPGGSNAQAIIRTATAAMSGRITGGKYYEMLMEVTATGVSASNMSNLTAYLSLTIDGVSYSLGQINGFTGDSSVPTADLTAIVWRSLPMWIPTGTIASAQITVLARFSAASATDLVLKVGRVSFKDLS